VKEKIPLDEEIYPISENNFMVPYSKERQIIPSMPGLNVDTSRIDPKAFIDNPGDLLLPNQQAIQLPDHGKAPGWFKTFFHAILESNELANAGQFAFLKKEELSHLADEVPDGWTAMSFESVNGYPQKYWPYLVSAVSPNDLKARQQRVAEQIKNDEMFARGSFTAKLLGGGVGIAASPSTYLFPIIGGVKYANFTQNLVKNAVKVTPSLSASIVANEGMHEAARAGGNLEDMALNSLRDLVFAGALVGGGITIGHALSGSQLWNMRRYVNANYQGIDIVPKVGKNNEFQGFQAVANPEFSVSAKQVDEVQEYVNSTYNRSGLLKIPGVANILGAKGIGSPVFRGLSHDFATIRYVTDRMAAHGIITEGLEKGIPRAMSAEENLGMIKAHATVFNAQLRGLFFKMNGIEGGLTLANSIKNFKQAITRQQQLKWEQFGSQIRTVLLTGESSSNSMINEGARMVEDFIESIAKPFREVMGWEGDFLSPRTSVKYMMQNYNIQEIIKRPTDFVNLVKSGLAEQADLITKLQAPVKEAEDLLKQLVEAQKDPNWKETRAFANEIAEARKRLKDERDKLVQQLRDNEDYHILLEDRVLLNSQEADELRQILEPVRQIDIEIKNINSQLSKLKNQKSSVAESLKTNLTDKTRQKNIKKLEQIKAQIKSTAKKLKQTKDKRENVYSMLEQSAFEGNINPKFFKKIPESFQIEFLDPDALPKLRRPFLTDYEREQYALALKDTLQGNSPEQMNQQMLGQMFPGRVENPEYMKGRTVLLPSQLFNEAGFLDNNLDRALMSYAMALGRHIAIRKAFNHYSSEPLFDKIIANLNKERKEREQKIAKIEDANKRQKAYEKLDKKFMDAKQFFADMYSVFMNKNTSNPTLRRLSQNLRNYTAIIRLGGVPITQMTDLGAIALKQGLYPLFSDGLKPMLLSLNGMLKTKTGKQIKENAAHGLVAIQHLAYGYSNKFLNAEAMEDAPVIGRLGSGLQNLAHMSGNFYGTNYIENINQTMVANIIQSKIMKAIFDFEAGKITKKQRQMLASVDINPEQWSKRFIKGYEESGGWKEGAGYQSNYFNWTDNAATVKISQAIYRETYNTIVQRGMFSSPFWTRDPILGMLFTFHGWAWGALNRYTIPLMQRPDAQAFIGIATMFGIGMLINPLRELANGREVKIEDESLFLNAFSNAGFLGPLPDVVNWANIVMNHNLLPGFQNEKTRELSRWGSFAGPVGGVADDAMTILEHLWVGNYNQSDAKKLARLIPFTGHLAFRRLINKTIERSSLPERRSEAEPWSMWEALKGE